MSRPDALQVLVRAVDSGPTYLTWRWLDAADDPRFMVIDQAELDAVITELDSALATPIEDETAEAAVRRALGVGAFADREAEHQLSQRLAAVVLPADLAKTIVDRSARGSVERVRFRITPSPTLARVPWELLVLPDGRRLLEATDIICDPPVTIYVNRPRTPTPWHHTQSGLALYIVDPSVPDPAHRSVLTGRGYIQFNARMSRGVPQGVGPRLGRTELGALLRTKPTRLFYFGHVSSQSAQPGSASLHLNDTAEVFGYAKATKPEGAPGHRPLSALDIWRGIPAVHTTAPDSGPQGDGQLRPVPGDHAQSGHEIWPMPPRVAIIACESGADHRATETFGLVIAALSNGAELVTSTRWTLPTDAGFRLVHGPDLGTPTTDMALTVDEHHQNNDFPPETLADWQRDQLTQWTTTGHITYTPLVWASLTHHWAPHRDNMVTSAGPTNSNGDPQTSTTPTGQAQ